MSGIALVAWPWCGLAVMVSWPTPKAGRNHAAIEEPTSRSSPHFGHGGLLNTILPGVEIISSCHVLPQSGHSNFRGRIETLGCITVFDELRRKKVGFFAFSSSWSRKRNAGVVRNVFNLSKWCFNRPIPARSPDSGANVNPRMGVQDQGFISQSCVDRFLQSARCWNSPRYLT